MGSALNDLRQLGIVLGYWTVDEENRVKSPVFYHPSLNKKAAQGISENVIQMATVFEISSGKAPLWIECELGSHAVIARHFSYGALVIICGVATLTPDLRLEVHEIVERACGERPFTGLQEKNGLVGRKIPQNRLVLLDPQKHSLRLKELLNFFVSHYQSIFMAR